MGSCTICLNNLSNFSLSSSPRFCLFPLGPPWEDSHFLPSTMPFLTSSFCTCCSQAQKPSSPKSQPLPFAWLISVHLWSVGLHATSAMPFWLLSVSRRAPALDPVSAYTSPPQCFLDCSCDSALLSPPSPARCLVLSRCSNICRLTVNYAQTQNIVEIESDI